MLSPHPSFFTRTGRGPRWSNAHHRLAPKPLSDWLTLPGSLTRALKRLSDGEFRVDLLEQRWTHPQPSESHALGIPRRHLCLIREVVLYGCDQPWIFARSVLPARTLEGPLHRLRRLDDRPLGEILFADPRIRRGVLEAALLIPDEHGLSHLSRLTDRSVWGRRSVFSLHQRRLLVTEIFLPDFPNSEPPSYNRR